jgi:hypothetical protein
MIDYEARRLKQRQKSRELRAHLKPRTCKYCPREFVSPHPLKQICGDETCEKKLRSEQQRRRYAKRKAEADAQA